MSAAIDFSKRRGGLTHIKQSSFPILLLVTAIKLLYHGNLAEARGNRKAGKMPFLNSSCPAVGQIVGASC